MQEKRMYSRPQKFTRHRFPKELAKSRHIASNLKFLSVVAGAWNPRGVSFWGRVQGHATVLPRNENGERWPSVSPKQQVKEYETKHALKGGWSGVRREKHRRG